MSVLMLCASVGMSATGYSGTWHRNLLFCVGLFLRCVDVVHSASLIDEL